MPIRFRCPCGQKLRTRDDTVAKRAKCPKCGNWLRVPESQSYETIAQPLQSKRERTEPEKPADSRPPPKAQQAEQPPAADVKGRIVVADSDRADLEKTAEMLRQHGYLVYEANDGTQAVELIRDKHPHAAILDVKLDILSGFKVIDQIRNPANPRNKDIWNIPVIMTTVKVRGRDKQYAMSLGAHGYFGKPVPPAQLCPRLEKALQKPPAP